MMLEHLGWREASERIHNALQATIQSKTVTYDLARQIDGATEVKCSEFAQAIVDRIG
jgi:isocitrate dehydrogenase